MLREVILWYFPVYLTLLYRSCVRPLLRGILNEILTHKYINLFTDFGFKKLFGKKFNKLLI